jgi:hypothetical protein
MRHSARRRGVVIKDSNPLDRCRVSDPRHVLPINAYGKSNHMAAFRNDQYTWWQIAEYGFDSFQIKSRTRT